MGAEKCLYFEKKVKLELFVKTLTGSTITVYVNPEDTIHSLKEQVCEKAHIPVDQQRMIFAGQQLNLGTIKSNHLTNQCTIHLVLRMRGGCFPAGSLVTLVSEQHTQHTFYKPIETVCEGDVVQIYNDQSKKKETRKVQRVHHYFVNETATLLFQNGKSLTTTTSHPIWVEKKGWCAIEPVSSQSSYVGQLSLGDVCFDERGSNEFMLKEIQIQFTPNEALKQVFTLSLRPEPQDHPQESLISSERSRFQTSSYATFFVNGLLVHNDMQVSVKMPDGSFLNMSFEETRTILQLKQHIEKEKKISCDQQTLIFQGKELEDQKTFQDYGVSKCATLQLFVGSGISAGGSIRQKIYQDPEMFAGWSDESKVCRVFVHIANADMWKHITGRSLPPTPLNRASYGFFQYPFYDVWDHDLKNTAETQEIAGILNWKDYIQVSGSKTLSASTLEASKDPSFQPSHIHIHIHVLSTDSNK